MKLRLFSSTSILLTSVLLHASAGEADIEVFLCHPASLLQEFVLSTEERTGN